MGRFFTAWVLSALGLVLLSGGPAAASTKIPVGPDRVIPVLVTVNDAGKVTQANPAYDLSPALLKAVRVTLNRIITRPGMLHHRPTRSQFVINLGMRLAPAGHGRYRVTLRYLDSKPVPYGAWYGVRTSDNQPALSLQSWYVPVQDWAVQDPLRLHGGGSVGSPQYLGEHAAFVEKYGPGQ